MQYLTSQKWSKITEENRLLATVVEDGPKTSECWQWLAGIPEGARFLSLCKRTEELGCHQASLSETGCSRQMEGSLVRRRTLQPLEDIRRRLINIVQA